MNYIGYTQKPRKRLLRKIMKLSGFDINTANENGQTLLLMALTNDKCPVLILEWLARKGADLSQVNCDGWCALTMVMKDTTLDKV